MTAQHQKIIVSKGSSSLLNDAIVALENENPGFKNDMSKLPGIQYEEKHSYCYIPVEYHREFIEKFKEIDLSQSNGKPTADIGVVQQSKEDIL